MANKSLSNDKDVESDGGTIHWNKIKFSDSMDIDDQQLSSDLEKHLRLTGESMESEEVVTHGSDGRLIPKKENQAQSCMFSSHAGISVYNPVSYASEYIQSTGMSPFVLPGSHNVPLGHQGNTGQFRQDDSLSSFDLEMDREPSMTPFQQVVSPAGVHEHSKGRTLSQIPHPTSLAVGYGQEKYPHEDKLRRYEGEPGCDHTNQHHQIWQQKVQQPAQTVIATPSEHDVSMVTEEIYTFETDEFGDGPLHTLSAVTDKTTLAKAIDLLQQYDVVRQCINLQNKLKQTPLFLSVLQKNIPLIGWLLQNGADPNIQGTLYTDRDEYMWRSPLHLAAMKGDEWLSILHLLLSKSPDTNINLFSHGDKLSALHLALKHHSPSNSCRQIILELINKGADVSLREQSSSKTPFMLALETRDLNLVQEFLNKFPADRRRAILQEQARSGDTCLHIAAGLSRINSQDKERLLRYLVTNGANGNVTNNVKELPRDFARKEWDNIRKT